MPERKIQPPPGGHGSRTVTIPIDGPETRDEVVDYMKAFWCVNKREPVRMIVPPAIHAVWCGWSADDKCGLVIEKDVLPKQMFGMAVAVGSEFRLE